MKSFFVTIIVCPLFLLGQNLKVNDYKITILSTMLSDFYTGEWGFSALIELDGKKILFDRLSNRDMKDKLIAEKRMKEFSRDVLHWINYDYVVINNNLDDCFEKINNLIQAEIKNGSKDYDKDFIRKHVEKLTL